MTVPSIEAGSPNLRIFRVLDESKLSEAFIDANERFEGGTLPYVDADRPRDVELTEEIMECTVGAVLVDEAGEVVAEFKGPKAVAQAQAAKESARITFSIDIPKARAKTAREEIEEEVAVADEATEDAAFA